MEQSERKAKEREKQRKKQERAARREMRRYRRAFAFFRFVLKPFLRRKFGYRYDDLSKIEGPYLLLANHNTEFDPMFVGLATKKQLFFVASEHIMRKGFGTWFLTRYFHPIIHRKGKDGAKSVFSILKTLRSGSSVALFAEGNRSFDGVTGPIAEATGKMAKAAGVPVVTFRFEGGFLTQPRFSTNVRKGRMYGRLVHVYTKEELAAMSEADINKAIAADLHEDAYEAQARERIAYKGKKKKYAYGLESTLCYCTGCGAFGTLHSDRDTLRCGKCNLTAVYDAFGELTVTGGNAEPGDADSDKTVTNLRDWVARQRAALRGMIREAGEDEELFSDPVTVREIGADHKIVSVRAGTIIAYKNGVRLATDDGAAEGTAAAETTGETVSEISGGSQTEELRDLAVYSRNFITAYCHESGKQYDIRGDERFNALKYYDLLRESEDPANDTH
ncbi:MAG: 1-acyl-sn-glycerol-3-phosphate acyltransferase [Lachnospiraceae bacterium]|nr:1-acyl-sn-glycerol-3-phosphate acyltransferase [Lachnospiraceae bacterium]